MLKIRYIAKLQIVTSCFSKHRENQKIHMTNYLPYIFGISSLTLGLFLFLKYFRIYHFNRNEEENIKFEDHVSRYGALLKTCAVILILHGGYNLLFTDSQQHAINDENEKRWEDNAENILVDKCFKETGQLGIENPIIVSEYCVCSAKSIMNGMTQEEYMESMKKPIEEQIKQQMPLFQDCLNEMNTKLDSIKRQNGR